MGKIKDNTIKIEYDKEIMLFVATSSDGTTYGFTEEEAALNMRNLQMDKAYE